MRNNQWKIWLLLFTLSGVSSFASGLRGNATNSTPPIWKAPPESACESDMTCPINALCRNFTCRCMHGWATAMESGRCAYQKKSRSEAMARNAYGEGSYWGANEAYLECDAAWWGRNTILWGGLVIAPFVAYKQAETLQKRMTPSFMETDPGPVSIIIASNPKVFLGLLIATGVTALSALINGIWSVVQDYRYQDKNLLDCNGVPTVE